MISKIKWVYVSPSGIGPKALNILRTAQASQLCPSPRMAHGLATWCHGDLTA
jgi:hypothetical protein